MADKKRRPSKAKTTARRLVPVAVIVPGTAYGTFQAVSFVSNPHHIYNQAQQKAAAQKAAALKKAEDEYSNLANSLKKSAAQLASLQSASSKDQAGVSNINNGISAIKNQKPAPPPSSSSQSSSSVQVPTVPIGQAPAATTTASMLAAG